MATDDSCWIEDGEYQIIAGNYYMMGDDQCGGHISTRKVMAHHKTKNGNWMFCDERGIIPYSKSEPIVCSWEYEQIRQQQAVDKHQSQEVLKDGFMELGFKIERRFIFDGTGDDATDGDINVVLTIDQAFKLLARLKK